MPTKIFSTYSTGENRITASTLAVLQSLSLGRIERLLGALLDRPEFSLVVFKNQASTNGKSVPDAEITASFRILVETKIKRNSVRRGQVDEHLRELRKSNHLAYFLLVLTPDDHLPQAIKAVDDELIVWASFSQLDQAINELLADPQEVVSEREAFLLRELQAMYAADGLIAAENTVVVVPARGAWPEYESHHAYICQPNRSFRPTSRIAFYSHGKIHPLVPRILETFDNVIFGTVQRDKRLKTLIENLLAKPDVAKKVEGQAYKIMLLSAPDSPDTVRLSSPVANDMKSESGGVTAFTQSQRYVDLDLLKAARVTSQLIGK